MRKIQRIFREPRPEFHLSAKKSSQVEKDEIVRTEQIRRMDGPWPCAIQQTDLIFRFLESFHIWRKTIRTKPKPISKNVPPGENTSQQTLKCRWRRIRTETWENTRCRCGPRVPKSDHVGRPKHVSQRLHYRTCDKSRHRKISSNSNSDTFFFLSSAIGLAYSRNTTVSESFLAVDLQLADTINCRNLFAWELPITVLITSRFIKPLSPGILGFAAGSSNKFSLPINKTHYYAR